MRPLARDPGPGPPLTESGLYEVGELALELGGTLSNVRVDYRMYGTPNPTGDNVVLFPHMYSGGVDSLAAMVGPVRALDPRRLCIVVPGQLGNGVASSPSNYTHEPFPDLTFGDDVNAQALLLAHLGAHAPFRLVIGYSMGAGQAYEWAVRFPERVRRLAIVAGTARTTPEATRLIDRLVNALALEPAAAALAAHARLWSTLGVTPTFYEQAIWRVAGFTSAEAFVRSVFVDDFARLDCRDLRSQLAKWKHADVSRGSSDGLARALGRISAPAVVLPFTGDRFASVAACAADAALLPQGQLRPVVTRWGHYGLAGFDPGVSSQLDAAINDLLEEHERR